ncbi:Enzymatic polyprotein [Sesbania bispinosa]|nr:Enzymatic polyprotein [Sesbania bispinosa]
MPKKATSLASSRGRGVRLALPGSFKQVGSSTQSGSSTRQPNPSSPIEAILPSPVNEGLKQFCKMYDQQESWIAADLKFFSSFSLARVFSWQYRYGKHENKNYLPLLQGKSTEVKLWFQNNPKYLKAADPETSLFLNQKVKITAALAASQSKESFAKNLQNILKLIQNDEVESSKKVPSSVSSAASSGDINQNEDDCFGIDLGED